MPSSHQKALQTREHRHLSFLKAQALRLSLTCETHFLKPNLNNIHILAQKRLNFLLFALASRKIRSQKIVNLIANRRKFSQIWLKIRRFLNL